MLVVFSCLLLYKQKLESCTGATEREGDMVTKEVKKVIEATVTATIQNINSVGWIERQKAISNEVFKNTERLLYSYTRLKDHIAAEDEYMDMINKGKSKSIVMYSTKGVGGNTELLTDERRESYLRSKRDLERLESAINKVKRRKGFEVIQLRYFDRKKKIEDNKEVEETYTFEEIAEMLAGKKGFSEKVTEKTIRSYRSSIVKEIAISLFGTDAI